MNFDEDSVLDTWAWICPITKKPRGRWCPTCYAVWRTYFKPDVPLVHFPSYLEANHKLFEEALLAYLTLEHEGEKRITLQMIQGRIVCHRYLFGLVGMRSALHYGTVTLLGTVGEPDLDPRDIITVTVILLLYTSILYVIIYIHDYILFIVVIIQVLLYLIIIYHPTLIYI